jgi:hypothetical protein
MLCPISILLDPELLDPKKRNAALLAERRRFSCGFVVVLLAGLKPRQMMPMAHANQLFGELRYDGTSAGLGLTPRCRGRHSSQRAPVAPPVYMVERVVGLL